MIEVDERDRKDYFTPSTGCFRDFCERCIQRYGLREHVIRRETVVDIDYDMFSNIEAAAKVFRVVTRQCELFARTVVLAIGGGKPIIPSPFPSKLPDAASHAMWLDRKCVVGPQLQERISAGRQTNVLLVGGGLTSAQIADCLIRKGVGQVHLLMRGPWKGE